MSLSIPYTFTGGPGRKAKASEVNANFQAIANKFTEGAGGIGDSDIASNAGIKGTKISNTPGFRIPYDRLEADAVDKDALRDDSTQDSPNAAVNSANHVRSGIIENRHLVGATILTGKAKIQSYTVQLDTLYGTPNILGGETKVASTGLDLTNILPLFGFLSRTNPPPDATTCALQLSLFGAVGNNLLYASVYQTPTGGSRTDMNAYTLTIYYWNRS